MRLGDRPYDEPGDGYHYALELKERTQPHLKATNKSCTVDETYMPSQGRWFYLYRAIDSGGSDDRFLPLGVSFADAAKGVVFCQGAGRPFSPSAKMDQHRQSQVLPTSGLMNPRKKESYDALPAPSSSISEQHSGQGHRAIKKRSAAKQHFRQFRLWT